MMRLAKVGLKEEIKISKNENLTDHGPFNAREGTAFITIEVTTSLSEHHRYRLRATESQFD